MNIHRLQYNQATAHYAHPDHHTCSLRLDPISRQTPRRYRGETDDHPCRRARPIRVS